MHLHCIISGGALDSNGQWHEARSQYLFPNNALSHHFRGKMVSKLRKAFYKKGRDSRDVCIPLNSSDSINDSRIGNLSNNSIEVSNKDYQDNNREKTMILPGEALIRRFLLHVLTKELMRIRHYGFLANRCRQE